MKRKTIAVFTLAGLAWATAASGNSVYPDRMVAGWYLYLPVKNCFMMKQFPDGTDLKYNWNLGEETSYLNLTNQKWNWIKNGESYPLEFSIDEWTMVVDAVGSERSDGSYSLSFFAHLPLKFKSAIESGKAVRAKLDHRIDGEYSLAGSKDAMVEMDRCAMAAAIASPTQKDGY